METPTNKPQEQTPPPAASEPHVIRLESTRGQPEMQDRPHPEIALVAGNPQSAIRNPQSTATVLIRHPDGSERVLEGLDPEALVSVHVKNPRIIAAIDHVPDAFLAALEAAVLAERWFGTLSWRSAPQPPDDLLHHYTEYRWDGRDVVPSLRHIARDYATKQTAQINREVELPWT